LQNIVTRFNILAVLFLLTTISKLDAQGYYKDIFVDAGIGLSKFSDLPAITYLTLSSEFVLTENQSEQNSFFVSNQFDDNGVLLYPDGEPRFKLIYTNGGSSVTHANSQLPNGRTRIRKFFANGGSYTGSCAGSAIFSMGRDGYTEDPSYYQLWPGYAQRVTVGPLSVGLVVPETSPLLSFYDYGNDLYIDNVHFNFGNYANQNYSFPSETEILLFYDIPSQQMHGKIASWAYKPSDESGRGVVIGCHPEGYSGGERMDLMSAIFQYAMEGNGTPRHKADLDKGEVRIMDKGWTDSDPAYAKIGDRQYHQFRVNLDGMAENFTVTLNGANGYDFNLYLRYAGYVTLDEYDFAEIGPGSDKVITVPQNITGQWFIAVELAEEVETELHAYGYEYTGNLEVLNGIPYSIEVNWDGNATGITGIASVPGNFELYQNYPNPFNPSTTIRYELPESASVKINVYNIQGRLIAQLVDEYQSAGTHHAYWNGTNINGSKCSSGIYIYEITTPGFRSQKQMVLMK